MVRPNLVRIYMVKRTDLTDLKITASSFSQQTCRKTMKSSKRLGKVHMEKYIRPEIRLQGKSSL